MRKQINNGRQRKRSWLENNMDEKQIHVDQFVLIQVTVGSWCIRIG